jgi:hypothetical protein
MGALRLSELEHRLVKNHETANLDPLSGFSGTSHWVYGCVGTFTATYSLTDS